MNDGPRTGKRHHLKTFVLGLLFFFQANAHAGDTLTLAIQPVLSETQTRQTFQPLADYISRSTGKKCLIRTAPNFMAYWDMTRKGNEYDLALDAAHFTDYRVRKFGFVILAKIPDSVSYSLIVPDDMPVLDAAELVAKRVATLGVPSIGAARLNALFPNPARQPFPIEVESAEEGMKMVLNHRVAAAILPTPIVSQQMMRGGGISVVMTTDPIPHIALSAAPTVQPAMRETIRKALLAADKTPEGKKMLAQIGFERFDPASAAIYAGQSQVLKVYWGY